MTKEEFEKKYMIKIDVIKTKIENNESIEEKEYSIMISEDLVTEKLWKEIMKEEIEDNKKEKAIKDIKDVEDKELLEFCNRLTTIYNCEEEQFKIIDSEANKIKIKDIDLKKLKGYRLETSSEYFSFMLNKNKEIKNETDLEEIIYDFDKECGCFVRSKNKCYLNNLKEEINYEKVGFRVVRTIVEKD